MSYDQRQRIAQLQRMYLDYLRGAGGSAEDDWARENLEGVPSPRLFAYLQGAVRKGRLEYLQAYFPRFAAHAQLPETFLAQLCEPVVTLSPAAGVDVHFDACVAFMGSRSDAAIWIDLLRLERADFLRRVLPAQPVPALVADLKALAGVGVTFDARGFCERPGISLFRQTTTIADFWKNRDVPPDAAQEWGGERLFGAYWCEARRDVRILEIRSLRGLALEIALGG